MLRTMDLKSHPAVAAEDDNIISEPDTVTLNINPEVSPNPTVVVSAKDASEPLHKDITCPALETDSEYTV